MKRKGVHDIPTLQTLNRRRAQQSRRQLVAELARMEQTKARLETERDIWSDNQQRTSRRLERICQQIAECERVLETMRASTTTTAQASQPERPATATATWRSSPWNEVTLEY